MRILDVVNEILLPLKLLIPQPIIAKVPGLTTNKDIRIAKVLAHIKPHMKCLDVGCKDNAFIREHKRRGGKGFGIDVFPWEGVDMLVENSAELPFEKNTFDCITFIASVNHIPNRREVLKEAHRILKNDGIVIITFLSPGLSYVWHKYAFWGKDHNVRGMKKGEVYGFTVKAIMELIHDTHFAVQAHQKFSWGIKRLYILQKDK
jgi:SAM-dependent methyltransferase